MLNPNVVMKIVIFWLFEKKKVAKHFTRHLHPTPGAAPSEFHTPPAEGMCPLNLNLKSSVHLFQKHPAKFENEELCSSRDVTEILVP